MRVDAPFDEFPDDPTVYMSLLKWGRTSQMRSTLLHLNAHTTLVVLAEAGKE